MACNLDALSPAERGNRAELAEGLVSEVIANRPLQDGWEITFRGSPDVAARLQRLVEVEQRCCSFLSFEVRKEGDRLRLAITGPGNVQDFLVAAFGSLGQPVIDELEASEWEAVARIYREGIATGDATFEREVPSWERWDETHLAGCRLVARDGQRVVGWAALSPVSERCAYGGVAEVSVYVASDARGKGVGKALLRALIEASEDAGIWTLQAGVFPENLSSIRLHEACGFRRVGVRERLGRLDGRWRDVVLLERRSDVVGC